MWGAKFSQTGKDVSNPDNLIYTSDKNQLKVSIVSDPPHLDVLQPLKPMTNLSVTSAAPLASEILLKIKHGIPFKPSATAYFNVIDSPIAGASYIGKYTVDFLRFGFTIIYVDVDEEYFYIKHDFYFSYSLGAPSTQNESGMEQYEIRTKYLISNARFNGTVGLGRAF